MRAFYDLDTERQLGMGIGPIPRSKIVEYAREHRLDREATLFAVAVIRHMDAAHLDDERAKLPKPKE